MTPYFVYFLIQLVEQLFLSKLTRLKSDPSKKNI